MSDAIGALRARVRLQQPARAEDELGGAALSWSDAGWVWAEIEALSADEAPAFDTAPSIARFRIGLRRFDGVRAGWRVLWGARMLRITGVRDDGGPRIDLAAEEESL